MTSADKAMHRDWGAYNVGRPKDDHDPKTAFEIGWELGRKFGSKEATTFACTVASDLEARWRKKAAERRNEGRRKGWFFGRYEYVLPTAERDAKTIEAAANGIQAIRKVVGGAQ